jgi:hypothetical protein
MKGAEVLADEAKERRGVRLARLVNAGGRRARREVGHRTQRSERRQRRGYDRRAWTLSPECRVSSRFQRTERRRLTVLAADERVKEARCARNCVAARSRSWR